MPGVLSQAWLEARLAAAPPALRDRIRAALAHGSVNAPSAIGPRPSASGEPLTANRQPLAQFLRDRDDALLAEAVSGSPTRETALTLLAADALVTLACEWVAEIEPDRLAEMR